MEINWIEIFVCIPICVAVCAFLDWLRYKRGIWK